MMNESGMPQKAAHFAFHRGRGARDASENADDDSRRH